jgi:sterol desaturase/sphingolipid hydroxylase (fatty acid hydroxylase superfamily)
VSAVGSHLLEFARGVGLTLLQTLGYYLLFLIFERMLPAERGQPFRDIRLNLLYLPFNVLGTALLVPPITALVVGQLRAHYPQMFGLIPVNSYVFADLRGFVYLLIFDFAYYWFHRAQHAFAWLWPQHKLHHSEESLNVTTSYRHHWLEEPIRVFFMTLPMAILFDLTPVFSAGLAFVLSFWGFYIHTNLNLHFGPVNRILCSPQLHRLHHSLRPEHQNRNFAAIFPVYDILFGTYAVPRRGDVPETGLISGERVTSVWQAIALPFVDWLESLRKRTGAGAK